MSYTVTVTDATTVDSIIASHKVFNLQAAKDMAWILAQRFPRDIVQIHQLANQGKKESNPVLYQLPPYSANGQLPAPRVHRKNVITIEIPNELTALATLLGCEAEDIVAKLIRVQVDAIRARAVDILAPTVEVTP